MTDTTTTLVFVGMSPCPNDTFMFHGLVSGDIQVDGVQCGPMIEDIDALNHRAIANEDPLPLTKLSVATLAHVAHRYTILSSGGALGRGCGPLVVHRGPKGSMGEFERLRGKRVAIPGIHTTAHLLMCMFGPREIDLVPMRFDLIMPAVARGEVDAGVVIHESRFTYPSYGLGELADLGTAWESATGLPLPLGLVCARRSLEDKLTGRIEQGLRRSIELARADPARSRGWVAEHADELSEEVCRQHIELYVTDYSLDLGDEGRNAVDEMLARGRSIGLLPHDRPSPWRQASSS
jgi:1,4-dihydroxy-6-naphthoate synthase